MRHVIPPKKDIAFSHVAELIVLQCGRRYKFWLDSLKIRKFSVMLHQVLFEMTSIVLCTQFCAFEKRITREQCSPEVGVSVCKLMPYSIMKHSKCLQGCNGLNQ
jgi:hypothetical protein